MTMTLPTRQAEDPRTSSAAAPASLSPKPEVPPRQSPRSGIWVASTALVILGSLLLGLAFNLALLSPLRHDRDQQVAYAQLRSDLAKAVAPIATVSEGAPVPLGTALGILRIESLGMTEVFFNGTTSTVLMSGPGLQRDTVMPGQAGHAVIYGRDHGYAGPFGVIDQLSPGTPITVITGQGEHVYRVTAVRVTQERPPALAAGEGRLTLVTATGAPYLPSGLVQVDAVLETPPAPRLGASMPTAMLTSSERVFAGDSSATAGLLMWSALLLICAVLLVWMALRWGRWQTWVVAVPVVTALGVAVTNHIAMLLPNVL